MSLGGVLGFAGISVPWVESGILASVLVLGLLIAAAARLPLVTSMALVGMFAIFHGHAHGAEMGAGVSAVTYSLGLVLATALLHVVGIGLGMGFKKIAGEKLVRVSGAAIAMGAVCLWAGRF